MAIPRKKARPAPAVETEAKKKTLYSIKLDKEQMEQVRAWCDKRLWSFYEVDYASFAFKGDGVNIVGYNSGKLVVQGKKTEDWVTYVLEAEITQNPLLGYDSVLHPEWYEPHAGLDESGKGDLFGPLVSACVIADGAMVEAWQKAGIQDSKKITSDAAILRLDKVICDTKGVVVKRMSLRMGKYNELYHKFGSNLNRLLAWQHAKCLEAALAERNVSWGLLDQFSKQPLVQRTFDKKTYPDFDLRMRPRAEEDPVVAAASICARAEYVRAMQKLSTEADVKLQKGASAQVRSQAKALVAKFGAEALGNFAKLHFRTAYEALGLPVPPKKPFER